MIKRLPLLAFALLLGQSLVASAAVPEVRDTAGFFSSTAINDANSVIQQIKQKHNRDLMVETFPEIPANRRSQYSTDRKDQFFDQWTLERGRELKLTGVYLLICRDPSRIQVRAGNDTLKRAFTASDREQLRDIVLAGFRDKQYDQALSKGVAFVQQTMDKNEGSSGSAAQSPAGVPYSGSTPPSGSANTPVRTPSPVGQSSPLGGIPMILIFIVGAFIVIMLLRKMFGGGRPAGNYPPNAGGYGPSQGGGGSGMLGGFGSGMLGGLLGGYLANRWSHGSDQSASSNVPHNAGGGLFDNDPTSSGGDFGSSADSSSSSGGDFGGGGDSGGGSSGGDF